MIKQRGLALKTFIFAFILITLVITVSFGILYFILPGYYLREKSRILDKNANALQASLNMAESKDECAALILDFAKSNNSNIIAFDTYDLFLPELSSPFLLLDDSEREPISFFYTEKIQQPGDAPKNVTINSSMFIDRNVSDTPLEGRLKIRSFSSADGGDAVFIQRETSNAVIMKQIQNDLIGSIDISSTLQPIDEAKGIVISLIPYLLVFDFIIALIAAYIFANQLTKPILKISDAAAMMQEMKPGILSNVRTGDELEQLSVNLDGLYLKLCENIQNLKSEMDKTSKLEQSKTDFMRAAGHELKTPIAALNGIVEGMLDNVGAYKNREKYLNESKGQIAKLAKLVNQILLASQLEHIEEDIQMEDINLGDIVEEAVGMYKILIEKKQLQVKKACSDFEYKTDNHILLNTLSNIISNAVNYTDEGGEIIITFTETNGENILSIENQCENIDDELLPKLSEPFFTLNYSRDKSKSGTGLGLYIVKKNLDALKLPNKIENTETGLKVSIIFK